MSLYTEHERDALLPLLEHDLPEGIHPAEAQWRTLAQKLKAERAAREVDLIRLARASFGHLDAGEPITRRVDKILAEIEKLKAIRDKTIDHTCHIARVERDAGALRVRNRQLNRRAQRAEAAFQQLVRLTTGAEGTSVVIKYLYDQLTTKITRLHADLDESRGSVHHWHHMHQIAKRELAQVHESLQHWMARAHQGRERRRPAAAPARSADPTDRACRRDSGHDPSDAAQPGHRVQRSSDHCF